MPKTDICYIISHGFAARMLFQTGLVTQLTTAGKTIALITEDAKDENLQEFAKNQNIEVYEISDKKNLWSEDYMFKRKYYLEEIRSNTALWEKHIKSVYYNRSKHPWRRIRPFWYYAIHQLIRIFPSLKKRFKKNEKKFLRSTLVSKTIQEIDPGLVISTYPVSFLEAQVLFAAQEQGRATLIHLLSWDNITCKGIFPVTADYYIVWGPIMYEELMTYYQPKPSHVYTCGVAHFDLHIEVKQAPSYEAELEQLGLDPSKPYLFFAMSSPRFAPKEIDIVEWIAEKVTANLWGPSLQLIVRPHPQNVIGNMADKSWLGRLDRIQSERVKVDYPQLVESKVRWSMKKKDMWRLSNLLAGCCICLNSGSTVSIDALTLEKPVMLTSFDGGSDLKYWQSARRLIDYPHLKKLVDLDGVDVVRSYDALVHQIQQYLKDPEHKLEQRRKTIEQECFRNDGQSTKRVIAAILDITTPSLAEKDI